MDRGAQPSAHGIVFVFANRIDTGPMMIPLELKAIGYGFAAFMAGTLVMSIVGTGIAIVDPSPQNRSGWGFLTIIGYLVPVVAGHVAAYFASARRIIHGTIGGSIGVLLLIAPGLVIPGYPLAGIPIIVATYAALASLGAIVGDHRRKKIDSQQT